MVVNRRRSNTVSLWLFVSREEQKSRLTCLFQTRYCRTLFVSLMVFVKRSLQPVAKLVFEYHPIERERERECSKPRCFFVKGRKRWKRKVFRVLLQRVARFEESFHLSIKRRFNASEQLPEFETFVLFLWPRQ